MEKLIEMLKSHEGEVKNNNGRHVAYKCPAGTWTVGIGRNINPENGLGLSDEEVDYLLARDIERVTTELTQQYPWFLSLDSVRRDAMIQLGFNLGVGSRLRGFKKALLAMEQGAYKKASTEFLDSRWRKQVGARALEICDLIATGTYLVE